jgi:hypothetical protein
MSNPSSVRIHAEFGQETLNLEGSPDEVFEAFVDFMNKIYPAFEMARQIAFMPDIRKLSENLIGVIEIGAEAPVLVSGRELPADETILLALLGSYIGNRLGKLQKSSLSSSALSKVTGKAQKTIMNQLPKVLVEGSVERIDKEYKISDFGIVRVQNIIADLRASKIREKTT